MKEIHMEVMYMRRGMDGHKESVPASDSTTVKEDDSASSSHHQPGVKPSFMEEIHKEGRNTWEGKMMSPTRSQQTTQTNKKTTQKFKKLVDWGLEIHFYPQ